jgi:malate synthase
MDCFDEVMKAPNQLDQLRKDVTISAEDLLKVPSGEITKSGLRTNISVGIQYMEAWLGGNGCVPLNHLMEDAATAEISRTQIWQWIHNSAASLADGNKITLDLFRTIMDEELENIRQLVGEKRFDSGCYHLAAQLFDEIISNDKLEEFLTLRAYDHID